MLKKSLLSLALAVTASVAACTSPPAMAPSHIALLHSGSVVIAIPKRPYITLASPRAMDAGDVTEFAVMGLLCGTLCGGLAGGDVAAQMDARQGVYAADLGPYSKLFWSLYPRDQFMEVAGSVADRVHWMGEQPSVKLYEKAGAPDSGEMSRLAQSANTQAVVLLKCKLGFGENMKKLTAIVQVAVYAKGIHRGQLIDAATFRESTRLDDSGGALKHYGYEEIAAAKKNSGATRGARANVWMKDGAKRYKAAVANEMARLRTDLTRFLNGRPASS